MFSYLKLHRIHQLFDQVLTGHSHSLKVDEFFKKLHLRYLVSDSDLKNIPAEGPYIVMANHPYGIVDSLILLNVFGGRHGYFRVVTSLPYSVMEPVQPFLIDPQAEEATGLMSSQAMQTCVEHLGNGYSLGLFPAIDGKGSFWDDRQVDLLLGAGVPILPVYFYGNQSKVLQLLDKLPILLRTLTMPAELKLNYASGVRFRIGKPITPTDLLGFGDKEKARRFLKICLHALGSKVEVKPLFHGRFTLPKHVARIIDAVPVNELELELDGLRAHGGMILEKNNYEIFIGRSEWIPSVLRELGRLRELTFRGVGEGTNKKLDVDDFDLHYSHLFVWDKTSRRIIGAYRLGRGDEIVEEFGTKGFYVTSLFSLDTPMVPMLKQTIELGRSFVIKEYQQKPLPLFLLWQGILMFLKAHPQYRYLMGPVSISNDFSIFSKDLIIAFIRKNYFDHDLGCHVKPHQAFVVQTPAEELDLILEKSNNDLHQLDQFIASIEPEYLKIPVLLKQYIRQNAKIIAFNVDPLFNNCLDGLMVLDLQEVPEDTLAMLQSR